MVKHKAQDTEILYTAIFPAKSEEKTDIFCVRCNKRKKTKEFAFWEATEGRKIVCGSCYQELMVVRDKKGKRKANFVDEDEEDRKKKKDDGQVLCPILMEVLEENEGSISEKEFKKLFKKNVTSEKSLHYFETLKTILSKRGFELDSNITKTLNDKEQMKNTRKVEKLFKKVIEPKMGLFRDEEKKPLEKMMKQIYFSTELNDNIDEWSSLNSLDDLRKLEKCLEIPKYFDKVFDTYAGLIEEMNKPDNLKNKEYGIYFWNSINKIHKLSQDKDEETKEKVQKFFKKCLRSKFATKPQKKHLVLFLNKK